MQPSAPYVMRRDATADAAEVGRLRDEACQTREALGRIAAHVAGLLGVLETLSEAMAQEDAPAAE